MVQVLALYEGDCSRCSYRIMKRQEIRRRSEKWVHVKCPSSQEEARATLQPHEIFLEKVRQDKDTPSEQDMAEWVDLPPMPAELLMKLRSAVQMEAVAGALHSTRLMATYMATRVIL